MESTSFDVDGPPSSPFVTEVDSRSRMASREWNRSGEETEEQTMDVFMTPAKSLYTPERNAYEDKENVPQHTRATPKSVLSKRPSTPEQRPIAHQNTTASRSPSLNGEVLAPPTSARRARASPKKASHTPARSVAATPRTEARVHDRAGLDGSVFSAARQLHASQMASMQPEPNNVDDTCFSTFSEAPDMTLFARMNQTTTNGTGNIFQTPRDRPNATPRTSRKRASHSRSPSPTPRSKRTPAHMDKDGTTTFLIDFTQQMENIGCVREAAPAKSADPGLLQYLNNQRSPVKLSRQGLATPSKRNSIMNLLDFELPPAPTPRSIPTITVRELESLKSSYLSQISSLKATLSGREAETESLKRAIGDAERRAGEAQEHLREEKCRREQAEEEKAVWEQRGQEVENLLKSVKEEVLKSELEKDDLIQKLEEYERRAEDAEARLVKAEERLVDAMSARTDSADGDEKSVDERVQALVTAQIDAKIEAVSRELHTVYKEKHERKVATLKKSYEARSEKKCAELQSRLDDLEKQNEELQAAKDATFSGPLPDVTNASAEAELRATIEEQKAHLARLENEIETSKQQQDALTQELKQERIEKGDLVAAVDEMLALQSEQGPPQAAMTVVEDFRKSIRQPSGLRAPSGLVAPSESRIGKAPGGSLSRSVSGGLGKSKMLANIERMGRTAPGAQE